MFVLLLLLVLLVHELLEGYHLKDNEKERQCKNHKQRRLAQKQLIELAHAVTEHGEKEASENYGHTNPHQTYRFLERKKQTD